MKKKLLVAMGDSFTEGVGCYDYSKMSNPNVDITELPLEEGEYQSLRFHTYGWPNRLGKKLNYDKVINLGWGGSGQSAHVKLLFEKIIEKDLSDYDVLVVWLISEPSRFSFYSYGRISQFLPNMYDKFGHGMESAYIQDIGDLYNDSILETIFYIKCVEQICQNNGFDLQISGWHHGTLQRIFNIYPSKYEMKPYESPYIAKTFDDDSGMTSKVCNHPNEKGYEHIAENMYNSIKKYHSHLINKNKVENFEWIWEGNPKNWEQLI